MNADGTTFHWRQKKTNTGGFSWVLVQYRSTVAVDAVQSEQL